jgi:hypothetical protein
VLAYVAEEAGNVIGAIERRRFYTIDSRLESPARRERVRIAKEES